MAEETGGRFFRSTDTTGLVDAISYSGRGVTVVEERELWDMPVILVLLLGLMGGEWLYRRREGRWREAGRSWRRSSCAMAADDRDGAARRLRRRCFAGYSGNAQYDGKFVFVRMSYPEVSRRGGPFWAHDYPEGEQHFMKILTAVSNVPAHVEETAIMDFDDPDMFKFPVIYLVEPGYWTMDDARSKRCASYLPRAAT